MALTFITAFVASLLGSLHCAAMCGGLVSFTCGSSARPRLAQVGYHVARIAAYGTLGALAGHAGHAINRTTGVWGFQNVAAWVAGAAMVIWGLGRLAPLVFTLRRSPRVKFATKARASRLSAWFAWLNTMPSAARGALLGLTSAVLPCGWLYAFVANAAGQGSASAGAVLMIAFGLGSVPLLVGVGGFVSLLNAKARRFVPQVSATVLVVLGLTTVWLRVPSNASAHSGVNSTVASHSCH